ncbi:MAG: DMT family transporter, partial [Proteobacteria bacterium]|nr:DMT family transporter [Pseudomonadota bacterium]
MYILYLLTGFLVGMGLSMQTSINGRLRKSVKSPFLTSLISFSVSFFFIALLAYIQTST